MSAQSKQAYYRAAGMQPRLAARYYREFEGARTLLDVGCGIGAFGRYRPDPDMRIWGVDHDDGALAQAAQYEEVAQVDLESDALPFADASFDGVLAKDVLEHLQAPGRLVREIVRVLRPGGVVVASVVMARPRAVWADYTHVRGFTRTSAALLFQDAGFGVEDVWPMGGVPLSNRLGFMGLVPMLLRIPGLGALWASSWELRARKPRVDGTEP